jgi:hypothetical protein
MKAYKPPKPFKIEENDVAIFLAGSINMGDSKDWQAEVTDKFKNMENVVILNPRRDDWDSSWKQEITNDQFFTQVDWEHQGLEAADVIAMHFEGVNGKPIEKSLSPITLLELGLFAGTNKVIVDCAKDYWRRGNVEYICHHYNIPLVDNMDDFLDLVDKRVKNLRVSKAFKPTRKGD